MGQQGRRLAWLNRELLLSFWEKKRIYVQWKKGQTSQGEYKEVASICREKIRKAKARHELNLATVVKDNKKHVFINLLTARRGPKRISLLYWMQGGP